MVPANSRPRVYPLPVADLFANRAYIALPAAGRGMILSLTEHFWKTGCKPLPRDDDQLFALARAHRPTWRTHKASILSVFEAIRPGLEAYFRRREGNRAGLIAAAHSSASTRRLKALKDSLAPSPIELGVAPIPKRDAVQAVRPLAPGQRPARVRLNDRV